MEAKYEIMSTQTIKPSSARAHHPKDFKLSFIDQLVPYQYIPVLLFYSASDVSSYGTSFTALCDKLKASLSDVLSLYYPFCGRTKRNDYVDCNDAGVPFIEARIFSTLNDILEYPQVKLLKKLLPVDPFGQGGASYINNEEQIAMAVQVTKFNCGAIALGVCITHKIVDGVGVASFLNAWVGITNKASSIVTKPYMEANLLFPIKYMNFFSPFYSPVDSQKLVTTRLVFDGTSLSRLRSEMNGCNPTRVEAVTALIWKAMMEASMANSGGQKLLRSFATHGVNIRNRMVPPVSEYSLGNIIQVGITPLAEFGLDKRVELKDLVALVRKAIMNVDGDYVSKLVGDDGFRMVVETWKKLMSLSVEGNLLCAFTSWTRFPFYEANFGWGKPTWVSTISCPIRNFVALLPARCGEGIEAWMSLTEQDMAEFERNHQLLEFASISRASS